MEENKNFNKAKNDLLQSNDLFNNLMDKVGFNVSGPSSKNEIELMKTQSDIDKYLSGEIKSVTDFSGNDISEFVVSLFDSQGKSRKSNPNNDVGNLETLFNLNQGEVLDFFHERYRNRFYLYDDLRMVSENLFELKEALRTTRDAIVTADDNSSLISATREFTNIIDDSNIYMNTVEKIEEDLKLPQKIKNHIIPNTLLYGEYFVYTMPYKKICEKYANMAKSEKVTTSSRRLSESFITSDFDDIKEKTKNLLPKTEQAKIRNGFDDAMKNILDRFTVYSDDLTPEILTEGGGIGEIQEFINIEKMKNSFNNSTKSSNQKFFQDGAQDIDSSKRETFDNMKGCFIKLLTPIKMIPIEIMNNVIIGYIYIFDSNSNNNNNFMSGAVINKRGMLSGTGTMVTFLDNMATTNKDVEYDIVSKIADQILKSFNKKFLEDNEKFKDVIISSLWFNDLYKRNVSFQFIPAEYVTKFSINEDEDGNGVSILNDALFYAKLYLALLLFKVMSIINKSNDTRIYYIKNSGMDSDVINKVQDVARQIKSRQMSFLDLMDCNAMTTKIGANKEIFMPMGSSGEKAIDFDIMSGQDIQLNTDLMENLRKNMINATGVPDVLMEYVNAADYAKTLVMANSKFVGRIVNLQLDFNPCITEMYKKILTYSSDLEPHIIDKFKYTLNPPRDLNINNMADRSNNVDNVIKIMLDATLGVESDQSEERKVLRDEMYKELIKKELPGLPWSLLTEQYSDLILKVKQRMEEDKIKNANSGSSSGESEY